MKAFLSKSYLLLVTSSQDEYLSSMYSIISMAVKTWISRFLRYFLISWFFLVRHESWYGPVVPSFSYTVELYQGETDRLADEPILTSRINFISVGGAAK